MRRGWTLSYKIEFFKGTERIVIERWYQLGFLHLLRSYIWLWDYETLGVMNMMKGMEINGESKST